MDQEQNQGPPIPEDQGFGAPSPAFESDLDVKISNTGQRVRAIIILVLVVVGIIAAIYWYSGTQEEKERHQAFREAFNGIHLAGYQAFWTKTKIDIKSIKNNQELDSKVKTMLGGDPVRYAKYIKEKCLPVLSSALPKYRSIEAPPEYADQLGQMAAAAEKFYESWDTFSTELLGLQTYFDAREKLTPAADAWFGAQTTRDKKYTAKAVRYLNTVKCALPGTIVFQVEPSDLKQTILDTCRVDRGKWFRQVANECMPLLLTKEAEPDEVYKQTLETYRKAERPDHASKFGLEDCLNENIDAMQEELIEEVARAWMGYVKAMKGLTDSVTAKIKEL